MCSPSAQRPERIVYKLLCSLGPLSPLKITHYSHRTASVSTSLFAVKKECEFLSLTELSRGQLPPVSLVQVSFLTIYCEFMTFIGQRCFLTLCKYTDSPSTKKIQQRHCGTHLTQRRRSCNAGSPAAKMLAAQVARDHTGDRGRRRETHPERLSAMARIHQDTEEPRKELLRRQINGRSSNLMLLSFLITVLLPGTFWNQQGLL